MLLLVLHAQHPHATCTCYFAESHISHLTSRTVDSPHAVAVLAPVTPFVVKPVGQGTQLRCFFSPGPYVLSGHSVAEGVPSAVIE